ncbi:PIN2 (YOR104W) [Zygosaccharomyces parabailii]|nr:PIN2 (YOR104W) [Zygosaccharomyces parabailii]CDH17355.1 uncharacterized protein ZBAI_09143 [Zygosaccharomyces bailii ISA1307]
MPICVARSLLARSFTNDVESTAKSFKSWDSCMNDKPCKIIAIIGIALASVVFLWLLGALLTCFRQGVTGIGEFCCWCCNCRSRRGTQMQPANYGYNTRSMVGGNPATVVYQPIQPPESAYYRPGDDSYYDERHKSKEIFELEQEFDLEKQRQKSMKRHRLPAVVSDDDPSIYEPKHGSADPWRAYDQSYTRPSPYPKGDDLSYRGYEYHGRR